MIITHKRLIVTEQYTEGKWYIDGEYFCDTLEDKWRDLAKEAKQYGITAIPSGVYRVVMNMSKRFKKIMPLLLDVPNFSGIRVHAGTKPEHSLGCILIGFKSAPGKLKNDRSKVDEAYELIQAAIDRGEIVEIEVI